ncbi:YARHG domain-containing protein [Butyricicoccus porcorum]|uniref:YARHG domain-containing protein n=1 Tax=Butyricicoccus porcorum TaxID=1945634 RepID=UPI003F4AB006
MYCNKCGTLLPDNADFCPTCGAPTPRQAQPVRQAHGKNSIVIAAIAAVTVVLVACIICFTLINRSSQEAQLAAVGETQQQSGQSNTQTADADKADGNLDSTASEQEKTETGDSSGESTQAATTVTTNYYYYGDGAASDNDYYTRVTSSGYLWPTDTQYISTSDLRGLSQDTVAAIRNEIYARHGYAFTTARWQTYFASKTWYDRDSTCTESTIRARLSSIERANISTIVAYEESKGWR